MRKLYPVEYVTCSICGKKYSGRVPRGGDGSALFPRKHYTHIPVISIPSTSGLDIKSDSVYLKIICYGSYQEGITIQDKK